VVSLIISDDIASEKCRRGLRGWFIRLNKARKDLVAWCTRKDDHIGGWVKRDSDMVLAFVEHKHHLVPKVCRVGAPMIVDLLTVVLWRQQPHGTGSNIECIWNLEDMPDSLVVQKRPTNSANSSSTVGAIESLDSDVSLSGRENEVVQAVGNASSSSPINQNIIRIRIKQGTMSDSVTWVVAVCLGASEALGNR
jgi:hypothetical protein